MNHLTREANHLTREIERQGVEVNQLSHYCKELYKPLKEPILKRLGESLQNYNRKIYGTSEIIQLFDRDPFLGEVLSLDPVPFSESSYFRKIHEWRYHPKSAIISSYYDHNNYLSDSLALPPALFKLQFGIDLQTAISTDEIIEKSLQVWNMLDLHSSLITQLAMTPRFRESFNAWSKVVLKCNKFSHGQSYPDLIMYEQLMKLQSAELQEAHDQARLLARKYWSRLQVEPSLLDKFDSTSPEF